MENSLFSTVHYSILWVKHHVWTISKDMKSENQGLWLNLTAELLVYFFKFNTFLLYILADFLGHITVWWLSVYLPRSFNVLNIVSKQIKNLETEVGLGFGLPKTRFLWKKSCVYKILLHILNLKRKVMQKQMKHFHRTWSVRVWHTIHIHAGLYRYFNASPM